MTATTGAFVKRYADPKRCAAARAHLAWLDGLESGVRLPALRHAAADRLVLEDLGAQRPRPEHLPLLADALGRLHAAAYQRHLHAAQLDQPFRTAARFVLPDFVTPRRDVLEHIRLPLAGLAAAFYKDANIRNFLLTSQGVAVVDFDDLTLAPFGYDLAKLLVSAAMTYGRPSESGAQQALDVYNDRTSGAGTAGECTMSQLQVYAEIHQALTAPYLHRNGYRHSWPDVRPWPEPIATPRVAAMLSAMPGIERGRPWPSPPNS